MCLSCRFMQSDPWWSLAMAINVYMVFFLAANPTSFRQYLWIYCLVCYGAPALPAIVLLLIRGNPRGPVYGNATVSPLSQENRMATPSCSSSLCVRVSDNGAKSCGAGSVTAGTRCAYSPTTSQSGCASCCPPSSTSQWATRCSTSATSCVT